MKFIFALLIFALALPCYAEDAFELGNAGDAFSAEFILSARDILQRMEDHEQVRPVFHHWVNLAKLRTVITNTKVRSETGLQLEGQTVDAVNHPDQGLIVINRDRWATYRSDIETKARLTLVLHEYLDMLGLDDGQFQISGVVLTFLNVQNYSPGTTWSPLNPVNLASMSLQNAPPKCSIQDIDFNPAQNDEGITVTTVGNCDESYRKVVILKTSTVTTAASDVQGVVHRFAIQVYDRHENIVGAMTYEPEWGKCVLPEAGTCQMSGELDLGGVAIMLWYRRK